MDLQTKRLIENALIEDMPYSDISSTIFTENDKSKAVLISKDEGILCGLEIFKEVFLIMDRSIKFEKTKFKEGDKIKIGNELLKINGKTKSILSAERTALNFLGKLSGIASKTNNIVMQLKGKKIRLADTRKTTPLFRSLEKYAVKVGGGVNHRMNLSDAVMLKDNHIKAARNLKNAVKKIRENISFMTKIEVEVESLEMVKDAVSAKVDIIMLDNMDFIEIEKAIKFIRKGNALIEVSGNITEEKIAKLKNLDIDIISSGAITHSAPSFDFSLKTLYSL
ncbi:MAG: carboxylating nicotinate-nucleotide diphosphorylase [Clostridiales Family XIII bacterium]|nr:carboxylating nicotinate-nucleotide diphosphorylase [Clostridiales Family XIII bacterium]